MTYGKIVNKYRTGKNMQRVKPFSKRFTAYLSPSSPLYDFLEEQKVPLILCLEYRLTMKDSTYMNTAFCRYRIEIQ